MKKAKKLRDRWNLAAAARRAMTIIVKTTTTVKCSKKNRS